MRIDYWEGGLKIWLSARETHDWANKPGKSWPCSTLADHRLFAEFGANGDLVNMAIDERSDIDCPADEFNAIMADYLPNGVVEIYPNGDPFGSGFQGSLSTDGGKSWVFQGDISPAPRRVWREFCHQHNYILRNRE
jgi:hypothetical protein